MKPSVARLLVFAPNWLGDSVMALPAIADVRRQFPGASLTIAAKRRIIPLFSMVPGIDGTVALDGDHAALPFDIAVLLPNSFHAAMRAWRAGVPERWGYRTDWRGLLLTRGVEPPSSRADAVAVRAPAPVHQVEYYQHLVRELGCPSGPSVPRIAVAATHDEAAERELRAAGWDGRRALVGLAPGAAFGGAKRWPPAYFAELARTLAADGMEPLLVGGHGDVPIANDILSAAGAGVAISVMGSDLPTLAALLARCRALVSNDSGAMHLGAAVGVRVTAVFGPTDERVTSPAGDGHTVLSHPVWCRPCGMRECPIDHRCMRGVGVDRVTDAVRRML